jgi:hypothetical protein
MSRSRPARPLVAPLLAALALSCASEAPAPDGAAPPETPAAATASEVKLRWKLPDGTVQLELTKDGDRYSVKDGADALVGKVRVKADRVTFKDASDVETRKIKQKDDGAEIETASGERLYRIRNDDDGSLRIKSAEDETLVKLVLKDDGYEVRGAQGATLAKVKTRDGQVNFKTEAGEDLGRLDGTEDARAAMWLAAEPLTLEERAALVVYYLEIAR